MKFESVIQYLGEFGPYQKRLFFLVCLPTLSAGIQTMISVFILGVPDHRCAIQGLRNDTYSVSSDHHSYLINNSIPTENSGKYSTCRLYSPRNGSTENVTSHQCSEWVYDKSKFESTFITGSDLVCDKKMFRTHAMLAYMGGFTVGSLALGIVADAFGRKKCLMVSIILHIFPSIAVGFTTEFITFMILRFITGISAGGLLGSTFVISMEWVGPSKRMWVGIVFELFWSAGVLILAGMAYFIRNWQHLQLAISAPSILFLVYAFPRVMPESPRWLFARGREREAAEILHRAADANHVVLPEKLFHKETYETEKCVPFWRIFVSFTLFLRCIIIFINWMVVSMVFYGLGLNVGNLAGDIYLNFLLSTLAEVLGFSSCLLFLNRVGRKTVHCTSMLLGGVSCILTIFTVLYGGSLSEPLTVTLAIIGKFGASAAFATIWVFSAELFPTVIRNSAMGASSLCARVGGMIAPYIGEMGMVVKGDVGQSLPLIVFGLAAVAAGLLSLFLPETLDRHLPENIDDAKMLGRTPLVTQNDDDTVENHEIKA